MRSEGLSALTFWEHVVLLFGEHRRTRQSSKHDKAQSFYQTPAPSAPSGGIRAQNAELLREMSTLGALKLEHVENFYLAKSYCPQMKLVVAEDNDAVIKIL